METTALRQLLKSLCDDSVWNYAVLWKLRPGNQMVFTWEDGHFNFPKSRQLVQSVADDAYEDESYIFTQQFETNLYSSTLDEHQAGVLVASMVNLQYAVGEGAVGKVASARSHYWVSSTSLFTSKAQLTPEHYPEEWLLQFALGIKTILLVPVLPHTVVQLGSFEVVAEDINVIEYVKDRFNGLHNVSGNAASPPLKMEVQDQLSYTLTGYLNAATAFTSVKTGDLHIPVNRVDQDSEFLSQTCMQRSYMPATKELPEASKYESETQIDTPTITLAEISAPCMFLDGIQLGMVETQLLGLSLQEPLAYSDCGDFKEYRLGKSFNEIMNLYPSSIMAVEPSGGIPSATDDIDVSSFLRFPRDSELHEALGPFFTKQTNEKPQCTSFSAENTCSFSSLGHGKDMTRITEPPFNPRVGGGGNLLEAVISNAYNGSDDTYNRSNSFKSSASFSGDFAASSDLQNQRKPVAMVTDDSFPFPSACITEDTGTDSTSSTLTKMNSKIMKEQQQRGHDEKLLQKEHKTSNVSKRRARPGDQQRPRPRDRQLIQDRVKELRQLIPNGGKCSIDNLLDQTIQHMLYLRSVTDQAEKLKQFGHQELAGSKNRSSSETKQSSQSGTSWAFELGTEYQCPILVEDLPLPGHMLIEMLCNDNGLFLDIAQVIRGLKLTILKGVLESRSNKTLARFIVETSKGFHRLDIFWPLMQLLQRKRKPISSRI